MLQNPKSKIPQDVFMIRMRASFIFSVTFAERLSSPFSGFFLVTLRLTLRCVVWLQFLHALLLSLDFYLSWSVDFFNAGIPYSRCSNGSSCHTQFPHIPWNQVSYIIELQLVFPCRTTHHKDGTILNLRILIGGKDDRRI